MRPEDVREIVAKLRERLKPGKARAELREATRLSSRYAESYWIGLSLGEGPLLDTSATLSAGEVHCISFDMPTVPPGHTAIWSIMATITDAGHELLWAPPGSAA